MPDLRIILAELGYSPDWLNYDLLGHDFWLGQYSKYQSSSDKHTEHYRFEAFQAVLDTHEAIDQEVMDRYIALAAADPDRSMGVAALAMLIRWPGLTSDQLRDLNRYPAFNVPFLQKLRTRIMMLLKLQAGDMSPESFEDFVNSQDAEVHCALLSLSGITPEQIQCLIDRGANKAIRNIARQKFHNA